MLSTKTLSITQKELLLNAYIGFVEYDAIEIELLEVTLYPEIKNVIFTSKNAVKAIQDSKSEIRSCFCVGEKTKKLLEANRYNVVEVAQNASELANIIVKKYKKEQFLFLCGNHRRDELPLVLKENGVQFEEILVYKTYKNPKKFNRSFDGVFFFSPSGVESYCTHNSMESSVAFCIGNTTASEVKKYTNNIIVANKPTVENVIVQAVKYFDKRI
ncbi:uroporphyrinogen-III synthase [Flavobacteriaceae bacterium (ex Bugula neritina AB1)]|nr:uroporphyrinogen-III synthase [Flavobacteriaceae bacterium (ex Bugula neritina AB1)]